MESIILAFPLSLFRRSRKNCQKCRLEKCLTAGMKPSWVLSDEERDRRFRKTREKKRRKIQEQKDQTEVIPEPGDSSPNQSARQTDASSPSISEISPPPPPPPPPHLSPPQPPMIASTSSSPPHLRPTPIPPTLLAMPPPYHPLYPGSLSDCRYSTRDSHLKNICLSQAHYRVRLKFDSTSHPIRLELN